MVVLLRPTEVPADLVCPVCMSVPLEPCVLDPCQHIFCKDCAFISLAQQPSCPIDRKPCTPHQIQLLGPNKGSFAHRIWCGVMVRCDQHESGCAWTGSIADYKAHKGNCKLGVRAKEKEDIKMEINVLRQQCTLYVEEANQLKVDFAIKKQEYQEQIEDLKRQIEASKEQKHEEQMNELKRQVDSLKFERRQLINTARHLGTEVEILRTTNATLHSEKNGEEAPFLKANGVYDYNSYTANMLAKLIFQDLGSPPPEEVDTNKIFDCIRRIYQDVKNDKHANQHTNQDFCSERDVKMLLAICGSSAWFTKRQIRKIDQWSKEARSEEGGVVTGMVSSMSILRLRGEGGP